MNYYPFPALLRTNLDPQGHYGTGTVSRRENAVVFRGEFIPLVPLGAAATVDWVYGELPLLSFEGTVYLSSKNLLRLVDVDSALVRTARATFATNTELPAHVMTRDAGTGAAAWHPAKILYLSANSITLRTGENVPQDQTVYLDAEVDFLTLRGLPLFVKRRIALRRGEVLLHCEVLPCDNYNIIALSAYSARLEKLEL